MFLLFTSFWSELWWLFLVLLALMSYRASTCGLRSILANLWCVDSIFHDADTGILFASFKYVGYDWDGDMERMKQNPKVQEWWKMTDGFQESFQPGAKGSYDEPPSWWKGVEEVFYNP